MTALYWTTAQDNAVSYMLSHPDMYRIIMSRTVDSESIDEMLRKNPQLRLWCGIIRAIAGKMECISVTHVLNLENELYQALLQVFSMLRTDVQ